MNYENAVMMVSGFYSIEVHSKPELVNQSILSSFKGRGRLISYDTLKHPVVMFSKLLINLLTAYWTTLNAGVQYPSATPVWILECI